MEVFINRNSNLVYQKDIEYISAFKGGSELMAGGTLYRKELSLNKLEQFLDYRCFFRVHKAYIVNLFYVINYTEYDVFVGRVKIPLSRRKKKEFGKFYTEFYIRYRVSDE